MVSTTEAEPSGSVANGGMEERKMPAGVAAGRYRLVAWDIDTSGRRLIDEIVQIAGYTDGSDFAQFIMPYADLNFQAIKRHSIRIVTIGRYRMLKDNRSNKFVKTKSELYALTDFVEWLEQQRGDSTDGVILIFHEPRKSVPLMLLEALRRLNLLERFQAVVKGFANLHHIAEDKCAKTLKNFSLLTLSRVLLSKRARLHSAAERARLTFEVVQSLASSDPEAELNNGKKDESATDQPSEVPQGEAPPPTTVEITPEILEKMMELVRTYTQPLDLELNDLNELKKLLEYQNTFRPIFGPFLRASKVERQHASHLRRLLAENNINLDKLESVWKSGTREALEGVIKVEVPNADETELGELLDILECYFDPEKKQKQPKRRSLTMRPRGNWVPRGFYMRPPPPFPRRFLGNRRSPRKNKGNDPKGGDSTETSETNNQYSDGGSPVSSDTPRSHEAVAK